uniref:GA protein n=1 Tax=Rhizophora mucronata TaxID=61149 RepID=A0A2P2KUZ3_RHIMU
MISSSCVSNQKFFLLKVLPCYKLKLELYALVINTLFDVLGLAGFSVQRLVMILEEHSASGSIRGESIKRWTCT